MPDSTKASAEPSTPLSATGVKDHPKLARFTCAGGVSSTDTNWSGSVAARIR